MHEEVLQDNISRRNLKNYLKNIGVADDLDSATPYQLIKLTYPDASDEQIKHVCFVVLAAFNLAKASEVLFDITKDNSK